MIWLTNKITSYLIIIYRLLVNLRGDKLITLKSREEFNLMVTKSGFTKRAFARKCGLSESTFIQISNGKQSPRPNTAKKICDGLQLSFDEIFAIKKKGE